jgi:hypothetical protein
LFVFKLTYRKAARPGNRSAQRHGDAAQGADEFRLVAQAD